MDKIRKVFVEVSVVFDLDGKMIPKALRWEDGRMYQIDKVLDSRSGYPKNWGIGYSMPVKNKRTRNL